MAKWCDINYFSFYEIVLISRGDYLKVVSFFIVRRYFSVMRMVL